MDPIDRLSLLEDIKHYGFNYPPKDLGLEFIEVDGMLEIKTPINSECNWWE